MSYTSACQIAPSLTCLDARHQCCEHAVSKIRLRSQNRIRDLLIITNTTVVTARDFELNEFIAGCCELLRI